jgi:cellulose synthase operon protein C
MTRGEKHFEAQDYGRAVLEFRNAVQASPSDADAHYKLSLALLASGDARGGYSALRKTTELAPSHIGAQITLAQLLTKTNDHELLKEASQRMGTLVTSYPDHSQALTTLAHAEMRLGDIRDAEDHLLRAIKTGPANLRAAVELSRLRIFQHNLAAAEQILQAVAKQRPSAALAYVALGEFYLASKREPDAQRAFERATAIESGNAPGLLYLGYLYQKTGDAHQAENVYRRLSRLPGKSYRPVHAVYCFQNGRREQAVKELEQLAAADSSDGEIRRSLVSAYVLVGKISKAEHILAEALTRNPKDTNALLQRSALSISAGKLTDAYEYLLKVADLEPNSAAMHLMLAEVQGRRGNLNNQRQELADAVRLDPELLPARLQYARMLLNAGIPKSALDLLAQTPEWQKQDTAVVAERNWALAALGRDGEMRESVERSLKAGRNADLLLQDALLKLQAGNTKAGTAVLEQVLREFPEDLRAADLIAQMYYAHQDSATAICRVREYATAHLKSARAQQLLGVWLQRTGAVAEARAAFEAAKIADPGFWPADIELSGIHVAENNLEAARRLLQPLRDHPHAGVPARALLATAEQKNRNTPAAIEHYRKILQADPDNILALNNLACALSDQLPASDEALKYAERAKELAGDNAAIDDTLGWILQRRGLHARAVQYLEKSVKQQPSAVRHAHLAMAYASRGDAKQALQHLEAAIRLGGSSMPEVEEVRSALKM